MSTRLTKLFVLGALIAACSRDKPTGDAVSSTGNALEVKRGATHTDAAGGDASVTQTEGENVCRALCSLAAPAQCKRASECQSQCSAMWSPPVCADLMRSFLLCASERGSADFTCDEEGDAVLRDGVCEGEQAKFASCLERY